MDYKVTKVFNLTDDFYETIPNKGDNFDIGGVKDNIHVLGKGIKTKSMKIEDYTTKEDIMDYIHKCTI